MLSCMMMMIVLMLMLCFVYSMCATTIIGKCRKKREVDSAVRKFYANFKI